MKILVIGTGGREHALVHTFSRQGHPVFSYPGNPGIRALAPLLSAKPGLLDDYALLAQEAKEMKIDLAVVGPEAHLEQGIQHVFASHNLPLFGPSRKAARIESSKAWAKEFMAKYKIPTARFEIATTSFTAKRAAKTFFSEGNGVVVKASGLAAGKGVVCCRTLESAEEAIEQILEDKIFGNTEAVVEELLSGPEISLQTISDGRTILPLLAAQDHKRLYENDLGPNTGGMGAYAPLPFLTQPLQEEIERTIIQPTRSGLQQEGISYSGVLYFGLMLTKEGPKVLEYNCRFGDPEAQTILPLLESDLAELMFASVQGDLRSRALRWKPQASCCVVLSAQGYPAAPLLKQPIGKMREREDLFVFHAGTASDAQGQLVTAGGRVLGITALGTDLEEAATKAYAAIDAYSCPWAHFRRDVGRAALSATL